MVAKRKVTISQSYSCKFSLIIVLLTSGFVESSPSNITKPKQSLGPKKFVWRIRPKYNDLHFSTATDYIVQSYQI